MVHTKKETNLDFTVNFSETVTVTGTDSTLGLTVGAVGKTAAYQSKTGTSITYRYTVVAGDTDTDGISVGTITLNTTTVEDGASNSANMTLNGVGSTANVYIDTTLPTISSSSLEASNTYVDVTFSEGIYHTGGTALLSGDLNLVFTQNGGTATNATISSITNNSNGALTGGESIVRVVLNITGTPSGVETVRIEPADGASIYDIANNPMSAGQNTTETLND